MSEKRLNQLRNELARKVLGILNEKGWTMSHFAEQLGKSKSHISSIINADGNLTLRIISEMEEVLGERILEVKKMERKINKFSNYCPEGTRLLHPKSYDGKDCIYYGYGNCQGELGSVGEHIFNSAWGGTAKSSEIICTICNNGFSSNSLDNSFDEFSNRIKNTRGIVTKRENNVKAVKLNGGEKLRVHAQLSTPKSTHIDSFKAGLKDEFDYDLEMQYRSTAHTCLKALAYYDPKLARAIIFESVKKFIKTGEGDLSNFAKETVVDETFLPARSQFFRGEFNHVVLYFSKRLNKVIGVFHLLGVIKRSVVLSNEWDKQECVITVGEHVGKAIGARFYEFPVLDDGMPTIMELSAIPQENKFKQQQRITFEQWRQALNLSYRLTSHIEKLDKEKILLTDNEIKKIKDYALELWNAALYRTGNQVSPEEIEEAGEAYGLNSLLEEYKEKNMKKDFAVRLTEIGEKVLTFFDSKLTNME